MHNIDVMRYREPHQSWHANIELRIPHSCIARDPFDQLLDRYDEETEIAKLNGKLLYERDNMRGDPVHARGEAWRIVFTDGPQYCPCCMAAVSPEAIAECRGERGRN